MSYRKAGNSGPALEQTGAPKRRVIQWTMASICGGALALQPALVSAQSASNSSEFGNRVYQPISLDGPDPEPEAVPEQTPLPEVNMTPAERCADSRVQSNVLKRVRAWLAEELPDSVATQRQKDAYETSVSSAKVDPTPPALTAEDHLSKQAIFCTLAFSATILNPTPTLGNLNGNRYPIEIKSVPYVWDDGVYLDLPPKGYTYATLTPYQKRLINSFFYRGFPMTPDPVIRAKAVEELKKRLASASRQPSNAVEGYQAMFGQAANELNQILRSKGLGKYVDAANKPLTPAQRAVACCRFDGHRDRLL